MMLVERKMLHSAYIRRDMLEDSSLKFKFLLLFGLLYSCTRPNELKRIESTAASYIAVAGVDTAWLDLNIKGTTFKGKCAISFADKFTDSGEVRGLIRGDTLLGDFHYLHYGLEWKRVAFALLRKEDALFMAEGEQGEYFNIPYFKPGELRFDSVKFVFRPITAAR